MLFEAMTGVLPFAGTPDEVLAAKQTQAPPSPDALVDGLPQDLVRLCVELLDRDPTRRPSGREVIALLDRADPEPDEADDVAEAARPFPLIGRVAASPGPGQGLIAALHQRKTESRSLSSAAPGQARPR